VEIARVAKDLLGLVDPSSGVRLFGVSVSQLSSAVQLSFGDGDERGWGPASSAIDEVRKRFGDGAVGPAALVTEDGLKVKRRGDTQWGPGSVQGGERS
jgi:DNA polymerase IV